MAVIVVETGSGSVSSNSYVSAANLTTYATDRGITLTGTPEVLLIKAMDYIESLPFAGYKNTQAQALQWPRSAVIIDGFYHPINTIPQLLIDALCELVIGIDGGTNPLSNQGRQTTREKIGEIEIEYTPGSRAQTYLTAAHSKISKLIKPLGGGMFARVTRG